MAHSGEMVRERLPDRDYASVIAFVGVLYPLVTALETALRSLFSLPSLSAFELTSALPIPLVLVVGPVALWGVPVGYVLGDVTSNAVGAHTLVGACAHLYLGYSASRLAGRLGIDAPVSASSLAGRTVVGRFLLVVGVAAAGAAAVVGWGSEVVHRAPFFVAAPSAFAEFFLVTLAFALPWVRILRSAAAAGVPTVDVRPRGAGELDVRRVVGATLAWVLLGTAGSVGYRTFEKIPAQYFVSHGAEYALLLDRPALFGAGAGRVQAVFGAVCLSLLLCLLSGMLRGRGGATK
ncbi:hypothetical protein [Halopelagius fulvigenes]|uniref:Uncharacterized protein n=1 Tax=Halopelagius fulvigenes TaxID=1198324 RepID=A0ABD5U2W9_9EURY